MGSQTVTIDTCDKCAGTITPPKPVLRFNVVAAKTRIHKIACSDGCLVELLSDAAAAITASTAAVGPTGAAGASK